MAITLYKKGSAHTVNGVQCDIKNFNVDQLDFALDSGYVTNPAEINSPAGRAKEYGMSNREIRLLAKEAGIDGYKTKLISTLKKELNL